MKKLFLLLTGFFIAIAVNAQVYSTYNSTAAGEMSVKFTTTTVTDLIVTGPIDYRDFVFMTTMKNQLKTVDLSNANIVEYNSGTKIYANNALPDSAFYRFVITWIKLPQSLTAIGKYAFYQCTSLRWLAIPKNVTSIGSYAMFTLCGTKAYRSFIYLFSKVPPTNLTYSTYTVSYYVPFGSLQLYKNLVTIPASTYIFEMNGVLLTKTVDTVPSTSASYDNTFTGQGDWTATSDSPWITINNSTGLDGGTVSYTLSANHTTSKRTAKIVIATTQLTTNSTSYADTIADTLTIVQEGESPYISVTSNTINIVNTANVTIDANVQWTATSDQTWLSLTTNGTTINLIASVNPTLIDRTATVTIKGNGIADQIITITQPAGIEYIDLVSTTATIDYTKNSTVSFNVSSNATWTVESNDSWLTTSNLQTNGNGTIEFKAIEENPNVTTRTATAHILYSIKGVPASKTLTIIQKPGNGTITILKDSISIGKDTNSIATVTVTSNTSLYPISSEPWLTAAITNSVITFTAQANPMSIPRHAKVTVWAGNVKDSIIVTQEPADVIITIDTATIVLSSSSNFKNLYAISNAGYIQVNSDQTWLTVTTVGNQNSISFTASANTTKTKRTAKITVYAADEVKPVGNVSKTIIIIQAGIEDTTSVGDTTAVGIITNEISIYPNPTTDYIKIKNIGTSKVKIIGANGVSVIEKEITDEESINVENLSAGYYIAIVNGNTLSFIKK